MSSPLRERVEALFEAALDRPADERGAFVRAASAGDDALCAQALALLAAHARADGILEVDAAALLDIDAEPVPDRLGAYRVVREIGRGGMGVVYEAERDDGQFVRRVAIKVLRARGDRELRQRLLAERQILAALDHPDIARLLDAGVADDGRPFLVMEHVDGLTIDVYCDRMRLTVAERLRLFVLVARAVAFAHRNLIVHRDLKPSNILVTADGRVKLLDFGIAKLLNPGLGGVAAHTLHDRLALTPEYASPEQLRGEALTTQSDVYALGVLLYELLTGRRPVSAAGLAQLIEAVCEVEPERPSARVARRESLARLDGPAHDVDPAVVARLRQATPVRLARTLRGDLDAIVACALRKEPRHRYASAERFADDIERYLSGLPVLARRRGGAYAFGKFVRRHRAPVAAVAAGALALVAGAAAALSQARLARGERDRAEAERDRAEAARAESDRVTEYLIELFETGAPGGVVPSPLTARDVVRRGAARIDELTDQPRVQARILGALGRVHEGLGDYAEARRLTERALAIQNARPSLAPEDVAQLLLLHGIAQRREAQYDSAEASFTQARATLAALAEPPPVLLGQVLAQQLSIAIYRGDLTEAERRAREGFDVLERRLGASHRLTVDALSNLGVVQWRRGDAEAERTLRRAIELRRGVAGTTRVETLVDRLRLTDLLLEEERALDEVESIVREGIASMRPDVPEELAAAIWARGNLVDLLELRGDADAALVLVREQHELHANAYGPDHPFTGRALSGLGQALVRVGRLAEAERRFDESAAILTKTFGTRHPMYADVLLDRARLLAARGDVAAADTLIGEALGLYPVRTSGPYSELLQYRASLRLRLRDHAMAESLLREALDLARTHTSERTRLVRSLHAALADLYTVTGRPADATRHRALARPPA